MENFKIQLVLIFILLFDFYTASSLKFEIEPEDTIVPKGSSVVLSCAAVISKEDEAGEIKYGWKKDGALLKLNEQKTDRNSEPDEGRQLLNNGSLYITSLHHTRDLRPDEGLYSCMATLDGVGTILSRAAKLQAASLARFDEEPEDIIIALGQTARFGCSAQGIPKPTVDWIYNNKPLILDNTRMIILSSGSLEISQIKITDAGNYQCNLTNIDKSYTSKVGRLVINKEPESDTPPVFTVIPKSQIAIASQIIILECSAVAYPKPIYSWLKDGITINLGDKFSIVGEGNLKISNLEEDDKGNYLCRAENREDSSDVSANLEVFVPPRISSTTPTNFYAYEREDIELPCKIYGKPTPLKTWYKNGDMIIEGDYFQIVNGNNLKILGLVSTDSGVYQCFGYSSSGNIQSTLRLQVLKLGEKKPLAKEHNTLLQLGQTAPKTENNEFHHNNSENIFLRPTAPREVTALLISSRFVTLTWKPPLNSNGKILSYAIFYKEHGSDRERVLNTTRSHLEEINIQSLLPNKRYTFRIVPYNEKGPGVSSNEISVITTREVDIPSAPRNLKAYAESATKIKVEWTEPESTNGPILKYKVYFAEASSATSETYNPSDSENTFDKLLEDFDDLDEDMIEGEEEEDAEEDEHDDYQFLNNGGIHILHVTRPEAILNNLQVYTEYFIWVVASNKNGPGPNSDQIKVLTLSDTPSDQPHNLTAEVISSSSVGIKWDPPPKEFRNGIITGYKIKIKEKGKKRPNTVTTDGNARYFLLNDLLRGTGYQIKIAAINVNGTGPFSEWMNVETFQRDLDESRVPDKPEALQARAFPESITISWSSPKNSDIMVRGYTIGWGKGIPDVYTNLVDGKQRIFTISNLKPNSDYVISLRAYNEKGTGVPIYENVRTRDRSQDGDDIFGKNLMQLPPVGLRAVTLSHKSIVVYWTDNTQPQRSQIVADNRFYIVRYAPIINGHKRVSSPKFTNTTQSNIILDELIPSTKYEFSVKVVRNRQASEWSLVAINTTFDEILYTAPEDLTLLAITSENGTSNIVLNWQPPRQQVKNDEVKGYMVFYTTDPSLKDWVEELIPEDVLTHLVKGLTPATIYYFRLSAKYAKGLGPQTEIKSVATLPLKKNPRLISTKPSVYGDTDINSNQIVLYILIGLSLSFALASVSLCIYYRKKGTETTPKQTPTKKPKKQEIKPPDLWIHHDQMELKGLEKNGQRLAETPITPSTVRGSTREFGDPEEKMPLQHSTNSLDKRAYMSSYIDKGFSESESHQIQSLGRRNKPKPIKIPVEPFFSKLSSVGGGGGVNDLNGRNTYNGRQRGHSQGESHLNRENYDTINTMSGSSTNSSHQNLGPNNNGNYSASSDYQSGGSTLGRRTAGNLKSFTVPIPPGIGGSTPPQNKISIRPLNVNATQSSPIKRISASALSPGYSMSPRSYQDSGGGSPLQKCLSTEELTQEISNLEGLMKDLNAITASEFQC